MSINYTQFNEEVEENNENGEGKKETSHPEE